MRLRIEERETGRRGYYRVYVNQHHVGWVQQRVDFKQRRFVWHGFPGYEGAHPPRPEESHRALPWPSKRRAVKYPVACLEASALGLGQASEIARVVTSACAAKHMPLWQQWDEEVASGWEGGE